MAISITGKSILQWFVTLLCLHPDSSSYTDWLWCAPWSVSINNESRVGYWPGVQCRLTSPLSHPATLLPFCNIYIITPTLHEPWVLWYQFSGSKFNIYFVIITTTVFPATALFDSPMSDFFFFLLIIALQHFIRSTIKAVNSEPWIPKTASRIISRQSLFLASFHSVAIKVSSTPAVCCRDIRSLWRV